MNDAWQRVKSALVAVKFSPIAGRKHDTYAGTLRIGKIGVDIELSIPDYNFNRLPIVKITNRDDLPKRLTAHMMSNDALCYADKATFLLDLFAPDASIIRVLEQAKSTLATLLHGNATSEFMAEFAAYWSDLGYCLIDDPWDLRELAFGSCDFGDGPQLLICGKSKVRLDSWVKNAKGKFTYYFSAPVVRALADIRPPPHKQLKLDVVVDWLEPQLQTSGRLIDLICERSDAIPSLLVVANNAVIGFQAKESVLLKRAQQKGFRKSSIPGLWKSNAENIEIDPFYCSLSTAHEITARNLNHTSPLAPKAIAMIGCGTIGSYLARALVQLGAGSQKQLLLIDNDDLHPENLGRHALGTRYLWKNKAIALKESIKTDFPDTNVTAVGTNADKSLERLSSYDLVIDATGDEQFSNTLNAFAIEKNRSSKSFPPIQFAMIFGNGVAAQSFITSFKNKQACYRCLKPRFGDAWRFNPINSKTGPTETVVRPCAQSSFTPFSVNASLASAGLSAQHASDFFSDGYKSDLRTVCIDHRSCNDVGWKNVSASMNCPACSILT